MHVEPGTTTPPAPSFRDISVGPLCGFVSSALVTVVGQHFHWPYRREAALAMYFVVSVLVTEYRKGRLRTHPANVLAFAAIFAAIGAAIMHF
jgi:hypothetical protein